MCYNWHRGLGLGGGPGSPWARSRYLGIPQVPPQVRQSRPARSRARQGAHRGTAAVATKRTTLARSARSAWGAPAAALDGDRSLALQLERNRSSDHAISAPGPSRSFLVWKTSRAC